MSFEFMTLMGEIWKNGISIISYSRVLRDLFEFLFYIFFLGKSDPMIPFCWSLLRIPNLFSFWLGNKSMVIFSYDISLSLSKLRNIISA